MVWGSCVSWPSRAGMPKGRPKSRGAEATGKDPERFFRYAAAQDGAPARSMKRRTPTATSTQHDHEGVVATFRS